MSLANLAVRRPVLTGVILLVILAFGVFGIADTELDLLPDLNFPIAVVATSYSNAGPSEVESLVTRPVEEAMATISGVDRISSLSSSGASLVLLEFNWGTDLAEATREMREMIDRIKPFLPDDAGDPRVLQFDPNQFPIILLGLGGSVDLDQIQALAEDVIIPRLERLPGVASVTLDGKQTPLIFVDVEPSTLQQYGLTFDQISGLLQAYNISLPAGTIDRGERTIGIRTTGEFESVEDIRELRLRTPTGALVRLGDLADVREDYLDRNSYTRMNGSPSLGLSILKESGANTVAVSRSVARELQRLQPTLPAGVEIVTVMDQSDFILESIGNIVVNTIYGGLLAVAVLAIFLRSWRSVVVISLAIPFSLVSVFSLIYLAGITMNLVSLGGLALGVGMMIDNAIVVMENIFRMRSQGVQADQSAIRGAGEVAAAITSGTLTTLAVFVPLLLAQGIASELFGDLALTVSLALLASLLMALTAVPMFSARLFRRMQPRQLGYVAEDQASRRGVGALYRRFIAWSLRHRGRLVIGLLLFLIASGVVATRVPAEFLPAVDEGQLLVSIEMPAGTGIDVVDRTLRDLESFALSLPEVETVFAYVGTSAGAAAIGENEFGGGGPATGELQIMLVDRSLRDRSAFEIGDEFRRLERSLPDVTMTVTESMMAGSFGGAPILIEIRGDSLERLEELAEALGERLAAIPGTRAVGNSLQERIPQLELQIDRQRAAVYGLTPAEIATTIRTAMVGQTVTQLRRDGQELDVRVRLTKQATEHLDQILSIPIMTRDGRIVPIGEVADAVETLSPVEITRSHQARAVQVTAEVAGRTIGEVYADVQRAVADFPLPDGYLISFGGEADMMTDSFTSLAWGALLGFLLMYLVMAAQFESWLMPVSVMVTVPMALAGAFVSLFLTGRTLSTPAFIGIIMLMGIIVNNAIVMVDYTNQLRRRGYGRSAAIIEAGSVRLRPVLMTALTTIFGVLPLALGLGEGAEIQAPLATVVMGGLLIGTVLTLVVLPVLITLLEDVWSWLSRSGKRGRRRRAAVARNAGA